MKITKTDVVYEDLETGVAYTREYSAMPIAFLNGSDKPQFGVRLKPYGNHPSIGWDEEEQDPAELLERLGYVPSSSGQELLVTEELFEKRFKCLGRLSYEVDLEDVARRYREENVSFADKAAVARTLLQDAGEGMSSAALYVLLKDYLDPATLP